MTEVITFVQILRAEETKRIIQNSTQCYRKGYKSFIKYTAQIWAVYLLMVRCGELWVVPFSVNSLMKSAVSCYACGFYSALKWQNKTCRQSTRASRRLLNAMFAVIIIVWSGTDQLLWKSNLPPVSLNGNSIMTLLFGGELISSWEISLSVICIQFAIIFLAHGSWYKRDAILANFGVFICH